MKLLDYWELEKIKDNMVARALACFEVSGLIFLIVCVLAVAAWIIFGTVHGMVSIIKENNGYSISSGGNDNDPDGNFGSDNSAESL